MLELVNSLIQVILFSNLGMHTLLIKEKALPPNYTFTKMVQYTYSSVLHTAVFHSGGEELPPLDLGCHITIYQGMTQPLCKNFKSQIPPLTKISG